MNIYTNNELIDRLLECDFPNDKLLLESVISKIGNFGPDAKKMFDLWYKTGKISDFDINGITPSYLRKFHKMKDPGIIIAYDWLLKDEKEASHLLKKPVIINKKM